MFFTFNSQHSHYDVAYNQSEAWYYQLVEVYKQKDMDDWLYFWRWLSRIQSAPLWFQNAVKKAVQGFNKSNYVYDSDLRKQLKNYKQKIENCYRVLIVAHSQGNFYANNAWDDIYGGNIKANKYLMKNFPNIGLLSVATPASHVGDWLLKINDHKKNYFLLNLN